MDFYEEAAHTLGSNKAMVKLIKSGEASGDVAAFQEGVEYGEETVQRGIEAGEISRLAALQAEKRGGDETRKHYREEAARAQAIADEILGRQGDVK